MKMFVGILTLAMALVLSATAGFFSVVGLGHLFAGSFWAVVFMGAALESGKLVAAGWLHANWHNRDLPGAMKVYLTAAVAILMVITALGVYGFLAKGHLEQEAGRPAIELQIAQNDERISQQTAERGRLNDRLTQLDQGIAALMTTAKDAKQAQAAERFRYSQRKDRIDVQKQIKAIDAQINDLQAANVPLKLKNADVEAKLGPIKYVARLFGWTDPNMGVQLVILLLMSVFDPLAITLVLASTYTIGEALALRRSLKLKREEAAAQKVADATPAPTAEAFRDAILGSVPPAELLANTSIFPEFKVEAPMPVPPEPSFSEEPDPLHMENLRLLGEVAKAEEAAEKAMQVYNAEHQQHKMTMGQIHMLKHQIDRLLAEKRELELRAVETASVVDGNHSFAAELAKQSAEIEALQEQLAAAREAEVNHQWTGDELARLRDQLHAQKQNADERVTIAESRQRQTDLALSRAERRRRELEEELAKISQENEVLKAQQSNASVTPMMFSVDEAHAQRNTKD